MGCYEVPTQDGCGPKTAKVNARRLRSTTEQLWFALAGCGLALA